MVGARNSAHHRHRPLLVVTELPHYLWTVYSPTYMSNSNDVLVIR
jgi:hypothetical protein